MKMVQFNLTQFSKALFNYLQQTQQLPNHFLILEDLKAQDMFIHKTAVFEPQKTGPMLVFQASPTYYGQPCYDAVSYLLNEQTHFGLVEVIFTFNESLGRRLAAVWMEELTVIHEESQHKVPHVKSQKTFHIVELNQITDLFAVCPDFSSKHEEQYFLCPLAVSSKLDFEEITDD
jgi:hypothetical protein